MTNTDHLSCSCTNGRHDDYCPRHGHLVRQSIRPALCKCAMDPKTGLVAAFSALCPVGGHAQRVTGIVATASHAHQPATGQRTVFDPYDVFYTTVDYDPTKSRCWQVLPDGSMREIADDEARIRPPLPRPVIPAVKHLTEQEITALVEARLVAERSRLQMQTQSMVDIHPKVMMLEHRLAVVESALRQSLGEVVQ